MRGERVREHLAKASQEHLAMWPKRAIQQHMVGSVAIAVQRGNAMAYLEGYDRTLTVLEKQPLERQPAAGEAGQEAEEQEEEDERGEAEYGDVGQGMADEAVCGWLGPEGCAAA